MTTTSPPSTRAAAPDATTPELSTTNAPQTLDAATVLSSIPVAEGTYAGYARALFDEWQTDPHTGCSVRDDVLVAESTTPATISSTCSVVGGNWLSMYDDVTITDPAKLDIDHLIPLKEAWDSGAAAWDRSTRAAFANDVSDDRSLIAVTATSNRSKGDRDPTNWRPTDPDTVCAYVGDWIATKARWQLTMDHAEASGLRDLLAASCPGLRIAPWSPATVTHADPATTPANRVAPTIAPGVAAPSGQPVDLSYTTCDAARRAGATPLHRGDPGYRPALDRDGDGVACE